MESDLGNSPATSRSIVNRAYYAAFLSVSIYLLGYGANDYKDHNSAFKDFKNSPKNKRRKGNLARQYGRLKTLRNAADYQMDPSSSQYNLGFNKFDMRIAKQAILLATDIVGSVAPSS